MTYNHSEGEIYNEIWLIEAELKTSSLFTVVSLQGGSRHITHFPG